MTTWSQTNKTEILNPRILLGYPALHALRYYDSELFTNEAPPGPRQVKVLTDLGLLVPAFVGHKVTPSGMAYLAAPEFKAGSYPGWEADYAAA